jgi:hypothetical protein
MLAASQAKNPAAWTLWEIMSMNAQDFES